MSFSSFTGFCQDPEPLSCIPQPSEPCTEWKVQTFIVDFTKYSSKYTQVKPCLVMVGALVRKCGTTYQIGDWRFVSTQNDFAPDQFFTNDKAGNPVWSLDCANAFYSHLSTYYGLIISDSEGFARFMRDFSLIVSHDISIQLIVNDLNSMGSLPDYGNCFEPNGSIITAESYYGSCEAWCVGRKMDGIGKFKFVIRKGSCYPTCCVIKKSFCIDKENSEPGAIKLKYWGQTISNESSGDDCTNPKTLEEIDFACDKGTKGEPDIQWLGQAKCKPFCKEVSKKGGNDDLGELFYQNMDILSRKENGHNYRFEIYPNPSQNILNIEFNETFSGTVRLVNVEGKECKKMEVSELSRISLEVSELKTGVYFLEIISNKNIKFNHKILITK